MSSVPVLPPPHLAHLDASGARRALDGLAAETGVRPVHAVLTGPLAWGLPYEDKTGAAPLVCAGLFTHPIPAYLGLVEPADILRDGGEGDLPPVLLWDARKALRLFLRSNATVWEWISASQVVEEGGAPIAALWELAVAGFSRVTLLGHYLGLAKAAMNAYFQDTPTDAARIKYMHTVRALMAVDWILTRDEPPPSDWMTLRAGTELPSEVAEVLDALALAPLERRRHPAVDAWIDAIFQASRDKGEGLSDSHPTADQVDPLLRDLLGPAAKHI
ncbi:DNA polymerase beta superfamily protein [Rhodospirillum sp. A1_3_36]|uniref:DNA polymerase beta superfamily protein n=1 Tax=Rhodospirillum sp. A1_3_36 TaxID=3391666 RepID=UPI0039A4A385